MLNAEKPDIPELLGTISIPTAGVVEFPPKSDSSGTSGVAPKNFSSPYSLSFLRCALAFSTAK